MILLGDPNAPDGFRDANIIRLKLIQAQPNRQRGGSQSPPKELPQKWVLFVRDVVDDDGLEANV